MPEKECEAAEYRFITERLHEWEKIYARDEYHRERDIRDDMLTFYRRGVEIQLTTIFELQSKVYGVTTPAGEAHLAPTRGDLSRRYEWLEKRIERIEVQLFAMLERVIDELGRMLTQEIIAERRKKEANRE